MQRNLDIFISYRRDDGAQYARIFQLELQKRGYHVFLAYDELNDDIFGENIRKAIDEAPIFIAILSHHYLDRCVNEHDRVRNEFKLALQKKKYFIFVNPDKSFEGIPDGTPEDIANTISCIQHSEISFGQALDATIDLLVMHRIEPLLCKPKERATGSSSKRSDRTISDVFISYSRDDKLQVHPFVEYISKAISRKCWIDLKGIESGDEFEDVIIRAIDECQVVLFMLSNNSLKSKWTKREVLYAEGEGKRIVPVLVNGDKLRGWFKFHFGNVDYIDINSDEQKEKLIANLKYWLAIEENGNAENIGRDETKRKKSRRIIEGQKTVKESREDKDKNAKQETNESGAERIESEEIVIPSDITLGKFSWVSKINEITKFISNLWSGISTIYKWLTYSALLLIIAFAIFKMCQSGKYATPNVDAEFMTNDSREMSQRLTEAIVSKDFRTLREFAIIHDSIRAYMPYAQICLDQEKFETADTIADRIVKLFNDKTLKSLIQHKRDSVIQVARLIAEKQLSDSLFKAANMLYINRNYDGARECIIKMDDKYRSSQVVQQLLSKIETARANDLAEAIFDSLYNAAQSQYNNKQFKAAKKSLEKLDEKHQSRQKVKNLLAAIEKAITLTDDDIYQQALKNKDWSTVEKLANKEYSKAYYPLAQWYYTKKNYTSAKRWAKKAVNAGVSVAESKKIIDKVVKEENFTTGSNQYQQWVISGDSLIREKAIQSLQNADQNNQLVKNMLNELMKERKRNFILH